MKTQTTEQLQAKRCAPCESGVGQLSIDEAREQLGMLPGWELSEEGKHIFRDWEVKDFAAGMAFLNQIAELAEIEGHHPDLRLERYRHVRITLSTHAVNGLTQNDFILAAKIDGLPVKLRR
ncbi:MAG: 4a-hydroxytetrahydrobiopterin dehydratase [Planctomycetota bacterium]